MPPKANMKIRRVRWAHRYYDGKRRFSRLSERARSERDQLFLTNLNGHGKQCCWNGKWVMV